MAQYFDGHDEHCRTHYGKPKSAPPLLREQRILKAIEHIAARAWVAATSAVSPAVRLKLAKQEALRLIRMLSPSIRGEVEHRFTSQKWAALLSSAPKDLR
jgi:hypothetical protein